MATKGGREKIKLESTAGTGHFYTTSKNKKTMPEKMLIKKFDPKARKHVEAGHRACEVQGRVMRALVRESWAMFGDHLESASYF